MSGESQWHTSEIYCFCSYLFGCFDLSFVMVAAELNFAVTLFLKYPI